MKTEICEVVAFVALISLVIVSGNNFPPVINPPPILTQSVKVLDLPPQKSYAQEQGVIDLPKGEDVFLSEELQKSKSFADQRFSPEAQIFDKQIASSAHTKDTFEDYYSGYSAIGPVATPRPDDAEGIFPAQIVKTSQVPPPEPVSGYWIITGGPENQHVKDISAQRVVRVSNIGKSPEAKTSGPSIAPPGLLQQFWIPGEPQNEFKNIDGILATRSQLSDVPYPGYKQVLAPEITKEYIAAPLPEVSKITPAPVLKSIEPIPESVIPSSDLPDNSGWLITKDGIVSEVRHIWVPTSRDSGQFITVPKDGIMKSPQLLVPNGVTQEVPPPATVLSADTWVLKQDEVYPRFERQQTPLFPAVPEISKEKVSIQKVPSLEESNTALISKSLNPVAPYRFPWVIRMTTPDIKQAVLQVYPVTPDTATTKVEPEARIPVQKVNGLTVPSPKLLISPPVVSEPCPKDQNAQVPPLKTVILSSVPRELSAVRKPLFNRVVQFGAPPNALYVLSPPVRRNLYNYGRRSFPAASKNSVVHLVSMKSAAPISPARSVVVPFRTLGYHRNANPWNYLRMWRPLLLPNVFNAELNNNPAPSDSKESSETLNETSEPQATAAEPIEAAEVKEKEIEKELPPETESAKLEETAETVLSIQTATQGLSKENELYEADAVGSVHRSDADVKP